MRRPANDKISDEFDRRNLFLCATLGLLSELRALRRAARDRGTAAPALVLRERPDGARGDEALHAVLGLLSLSRTLAAHARTLPGAPRERRATAPEATPPGPLRSLLV